MDSLLNFSKCPNCQSRRLATIGHGKRLGYSAPDEVKCIKCGAAFERVQGKYRCINVTDKGCQFWKSFGEITLSIEQWEEPSDETRQCFVVKSDGDASGNPGIDAAPKPAARARLSESGYGTQRLPQTGTGMQLPALKNVAQKENLSPPPAAVSRRLRHAETDDKPMPASTIRVKDTTAAPELPGKPEYCLAEAGKRLLKIKFEDLLTNYHLLKCFEDGRELKPEDIAYLSASGFIGLEDK